ncbi:unnamed protein product [Peronospora destructor]|uniref:Uncharacterized protein n=1 Tax=Peronospora destructor TaxID=86335 RepID=A0AAV0U982_9STRA|nr:unnamed protein product [Peronospora destructor]
MTTIERRLTKNIPFFDSRSSEENDPSFTTEDEEVDETFVALQKMLKTLNRSNRTRENSSNSSNGNFLSNSSNAQVAPANDSTNQQRMTREEMLESRRQERDRFRRSLFAKNNKNSANNSHRRCTYPVYYCSEEEEEEEVPEPSVESTISNRFMNGSFSNLNVHIISRSRWSTEDRVIERLPIVMLSKSGKMSIPTDNKKISVSSMHYLTPPRSTWYMRMHDFEEIKW